MKYSLIYADPAWSYRDKANDGCRGASHKYPVMSVQEICRLPVWELANPESCLLAMWWVPTQPREALQVLEAWGFRLMTTKGFTWHKTNKHKGNSAMGMGHMTRANSEDMLFAVRGRLPARLDASICQHVTAPRGAHSAKPDIFRQLLVQLLGDVPRIELFSRSDAAGWDHWGNEAPSNSIEQRPGVAIFPANDNIADIVSRHSPDLSWLVRETKGEWFGNSTHIARQGLEDLLWANSSVQEIVHRYPGYHWFTKAEYLLRKAELQKKPSWSDAPEWTTYLGQNCAGLWTFTEFHPRPNDGGGWSMQVKEGRRHFIKVDEGQEGEVFGDWRDTLERRPADISANDNSEGMGVVA